MRGVVFLHLNLAVVCVVAAVSASAAPGPGAHGMVLLDRAFDAGTLASARVFDGGSDGSASGTSAGATGNVSRATFLIGAGIVASAIIAAAWLLRPAEPCRVPLRLRWSARWWSDLVDRGPNDPPPPPPPALLAEPAPEGCFYG